MITKLRLAGALLSMLSLAACGAPLAAVPTASVRTAAATSPVAAVGGWIISAHALQGLLAIDHSGVVARAIDRPSTFLLVTGPNQVPTGWTVRPTQSFTRSTDLVDAVTGMHGHHLVSGVQAVLLDIERWQFTPPDEQNDPVAAYTKAFEAAQANHVTLIATPGLDLAEPTAKKLHKPTWRAYLDNLRLPEKIAPHADVFEVQSQGQEAQPSTFADLLARAEAQADKANPKAIVFGGVSTSIPGDPTATVTGEEMADAVQATHGGEARYWLNDPAKGKFCPTCTGPHPAVAVKFLSLAG